MTTTSTTTNNNNTSASPPPASYADAILSGSGTQVPATRFAFHDFLRKEYRFGLDPSRKTCPLFVQGHCPLGNSCPDKHAVSSTFNNLVCKHWLRSLCKKGEGCEFLHEYNL
jgi:cleavage and polyadenylation specificity factor subunit 4